MIKEIIISEDQYLADQRAKVLTNDYDIVRATSFTENEISILRQRSMFGRTAVILNGKLEKSDEEMLEMFLSKEHDLSSALIYSPGYDDRRKKIFKSEHVVRLEKPKGPELFSLLVQISTDNNVKVDEEVIDYLIDYSEYESDSKISLYDLMGAIKASAGTPLTKEHIEKNLVRSEKDDAFKLIQLIGDTNGLTEYMSRLTANPHMIIGSLLYAFRIMAKLKISNDIGISSFQTSQYLLIKDRWSLEEIISKMKLLTQLKGEHEGSGVMRALILSILLE